MNFLTRRPEEEDPLHPVDPLAPADPLAMPHPAAPQVLNQTAANTGGGGGAPPPAIPGAVVFQQPERSDRTETRGPQDTVKTKEMSPESAAALTASAAGGQKELEASREMAGADAKIAEADALAAEKQAINEQLRANERAQAQERRQQEVDARMAERAEAQKAHEANGKITTYWEDKSVPTKVFAALMVGLNQYANSGRGMPGGNTALQIFEHAEAADRQAKMDKFTRSKEFVELKRQNVVEAQEALKNELLKIDDLSIARGKMLAAQSLAVTKRLGIPKAIAAANELSAKIEQKNADTTLKQRQVYEADKTHENAVTTTGHTVNTNNSGQPETGAKFAVRTLAGSVAGPAATKEEGEKLRAQWAETHALRRDGLALNKFLEENGGKPLDPSKRRDLENLKQAFVGHLTKDRATLTLQKDEWERYSDTLTPGYLESLTGGKSNLIHDIINAGGRNYNQAMRAQGLDPGARTPTAAPASEASPRPARHQSKPAVRTKELNGKRYVNDGTGWIELP